MKTLSILKFVKKVGIIVSFLVTRVICCYIHSNCYYHFFVYTKQTKKRWLSQVVRYWRIGVQQEYTFYHNKVVEFLCPSIMGLKVGYLVHLGISKILPIVKKSFFDNLWWLLTKTERWCAKMKTHFNYISSCRVLLASLTDSIVGYLAPFCTSKFLPVKKGPSSPTLSVILTKI